MEMPSRASGTFRWARQEAASCSWEVTTPRGAGVSGPLVPWFPVTSLDDPFIQS